MAGETGYALVDNATGEFIELSKEEMSTISTRLYEQTTKDKAQWSPPRVREHNFDLHLKVGHFLAGLRKMAGG